MDFMVVLRFWHIYVRKISAEQATVLLDYAKVPRFLNACFVCLSHACHVFVQILRGFFFVIFRYGEGFGLAVF